VENGKVDIAKIQSFMKKSLHDVLILDTAGRLHVETDMLQELSMINKQLNPQEVLWWSTPCLVKRQRTSLNLLKKLLRLVV